MARSLWVAALLMSSLGLVACVSEEPDLPPSRTPKAAVVAGCVGSSAVIPAEATVECVEGPEARTALSFTPIELLDAADATLLQSARVTIDSRVGLFERFRLASGELLEVLQGDIAPPVLPDGTPREPLVIGQPIGGGSPMGEFRDAVVGSVLYWCPLADKFGAGPIDGPCPGNHTVVLYGLRKTELARLVYVITSGGRYSDGSGGTTASAPSPVPFPAPRGERVEPLVKGVPQFPAAVEVDGFVIPATDYWGEQAVQQFSTASFPEEVLAFFDTELTAAGWQPYGGSYGVSGQGNTYVRDRDQVTVTSEFQLRPEERSATEPPPGFQGKGVPFADRENGKSYFFIITMLK